MVPFRVMKGEEWVEGDVDQHQANWVEAGKLTSVEQARAEAQLIVEQSVTQADPKVDGHLVTACSVRWHPRVERVDLATQLPVENLVDYQGDGDNLSIQRV